MFVFYPQLFKIIVLLKHSPIGKWNLLGSAKCNFPIRDKQMVPLGIRGAAKDEGN